MIEPLLDRIQELERSNRRWKVTSLILGLVLLAIMSTGSVFVGIQGYRHHRERQAMQARDEALLQELLVKEEVEAQVRAQQKANKE